MSEMTLVFGNKNYSSWSLRPWIFLKHHEIDFTEKRIPLFTDTTNQQLEEYYSDYKVPVLVDGDLIVWDTLAILEYLSEKYLGGNGWPDDEHARAHARSVSAEMHSSFVNVRSEMPMNCRKQTTIKLSEEAEREVGRIRTLWRYCRKHYGGNGEWLFGEFSIADAMYAPVAIRFNGYGVKLDGIEAEYVKSLLNHPAMLEWIEAGKNETEIIEQDEIDE